MIQQRTVVYCRECNVLVQINDKLSSVMAQKCRMSVYFSVQCPCTTLSNVRVLQCPMSVYYIVQCPRTTVVYPEQLLQYPDKSQVCLSRNQKFAAQIQLENYQKKISRMHLPLYLILSPD